MGSATIYWDLAAVWDYIPQRSLTWAQFPQPHGLSRCQVTVRQGSVSPPSSSDLWSKKKYPFPRCLIKDVAIPCDRPVVWAGSKGAGTEPGN